DRRSFATPIRRSRCRPSPGRCDREPPGPADDVVGGPGRAGPLTRRGPGGRGCAGPWSCSGFVLLPRGGGAVGVDDQGPAPAVDDDLVVEGAQQHAVLDGGGAAVGLVPGVV